MRRLLNKLLSSVMLLFIRKEAPPVVEIAEESKVAALEEVVALAPDAEKRTNWGSLHNRDDILENLPDYFHTIKLLKKYDRDAYGLYSKIGGQVITKHTLMDPHELSPLWRTGAKRPSIGLLHLHQRGSDEIVLEEGDGQRVICPSFIYFQRIKSRAHVQPMNSADMFEVVMFYAGKNDPSIRHAASFYIAVDAAGRTHPLKEYGTKVIPLRNRRRDGIPVKQWANSIYLEHLALDWNDANPDRPKRTADDVARYIFALAANTIENATAGIQVRVKKDNLCAMFNIDMLRTPYFFKDRNKVVNENGVTKRICHVVRPHTRKNGQHVKWHTKGLKKFEWNGYDVHITIPDRDHNAVNEMQADGYEVDGATPKDFITMPKLGKLVGDYLDAA